MTTPRLAREDAPIVVNPRVTLSAYRCPDGAPQGVRCSDRGPGVFLGAAVPLSVFCAKPTLCATPH